MKLGNPNLEIQFQPPTATTVGGGGFWVSF